MGGEEGEEIIGWNGRGDDEGAVLGVGMVLGKRKGKWIGMDWLDIPCSVISEKFRCITRLVNTDISAQIGYSNANGCIADL